MSCLLFGCQLDRQFWRRAFCCAALGSSEGLGQSVPSPWTGTFGCCTQRSQIQRTLACQGASIASPFSKFQCALVGPAACSNASQQTVAHCCVALPWWHNRRQCLLALQCHWRPGRSPQSHPHLKEHTIMPLKSITKGMPYQEYWLIINLSLKANKG